MKPLDLTKPLCSNDGKRTPFILLSDKGIGRYPIGGYFKGDQFAQFYTDDGKELEDDPKPRIINAPAKRKIKFWVNVYPDDDPDELFAVAYCSKKEADEDALCYCIACLEFEREFEEGEGLK